MCRTRRCSRLILSLILASGLLLCTGLAQAAEPEAGVVDVKLGATIERTWKQIKEDGYDYGPKQTVDAKKGETIVFLPYGNNPSLYHEVKGKLRDVASNKVAAFSSTDANTNAALTYKFHFDKPISSFRFSTVRVDVDLADNTVAGVEYSTDGAGWTTLMEVKGSEGKGSKTLNTIGGSAAKLNTETLYVRCYTRDPKAPEASGPGRWMMITMSGDPRWGDISTTFFPGQPHLFVTAAKPAAENKAK